MAGFRKAQPQQAFAKLGIYGPQGSGKTFTGLLLAEGCAKATGKRIAVIDTERGTDFYAQPVRDRRLHPDAFDFDALYTRSIVDALEALRGLDPAVYCCAMIDSVTHLWDAAIAAYSGKTTKIDSIPFHAWGKIKAPYKAMMTWFINAPMHGIICGRQANEFGKDEAGELTKVGVKMRAEGETAYEPHILIRMEQIRQGASEAAVQAFVEKDRTGVLSGRVLANPTFDSILKPIWPLLTGQQAKIEEADDTAAHDAEAIAAQDAKKDADSAKLLRFYSAKMDMCEHQGDLKAIGAELTPETKAKLTTEHVKLLREHYLDREGKLPPAPKPSPPAPDAPTVPPTNGKPPESASDRMAARVGASGNSNSSP